MKKTAIIVMLITIASKIFGFSREIILSYFYGATDITDAYLISMTIPSVIFGFIATGISTGYIPMYSQIEKEGGSKESNKFMSNLINILLVLSTCLVIFGLIFTQPIVKIFASGFEGETLRLAIRFTRVSLVSMYFIGIVSIFTGYLQLSGNFVIPALVGFPLNIVTILAIIISSKGNPIILAIGTVISVVAQLLFVLPFVRKRGYRHKWVLDFRNPNIKKMVYIVIPVMLGTSINQINVLVDRTLASGLAVGGISALNYANKLNGFVQGIFVSSIVVVLYPMISKMVSEGNEDGLKRSVAEAITSVNLLVVPATIGMMFFAEPIVSLLFGRGKFDSTAIAMTTSALFFYTIGMVGFGLREVLSRTFYAFQDTKTPAINAAIAVVINIVLNLILSRYLGIGGLALATSIAAIVGTGLLFVSLRKKIGPFGLKEISISFVKILIASLAMGGIAILFFNMMKVGVAESLALILAILLGMVSYAVIVYFMKIDDVDKMVAAVKKKLKRVG